jgi:hypothetical protein
MTKRPTTDEDTIRLIEQLRHLATGLHVPDPPDLRAAVRARLTPATPARQRRWRRWLIALIAAALAAALAATPPARAALGHILRFAGVDVHTEPGPRPIPSTAPGPLPTQYTSLGQARARAGFPIGVPASLGPPDEVQLLDVSDGRPRVVSLLWQAARARPTPAAAAHVALRLDEFDGQLDPTFAKRANPSGIQWLSLSDGYALWIPGPHALTYIDRSGVEHTDAPRLSGPTLIWQHSTVTYRLEGAPNVEQAVAIASSIR